MLKHRLLILFLTVFSLGLSAQDVQFNASAKNNLGQGENFYLKYTLNKKGSNLQTPDFGKFQVLNGPSTSTSSSTQIVNGNVTHSYTFTYTYVLKAPKETGTYTIPPAKVRVDGKEYSSNTLKINVSQTPQNAQTPQNPTINSTQERVSNSGNNFVRIHLNKSTAYIGEPIFASFKLYLSNRNLAGFQNIKFPDFNGFWVEDVNTPSQIHLNIEQYQGQNYYVAELKSVLLFPQRSGELEISGGEFDIVLQERVTDNQSRSLFDSFFGRYENVEYQLKSNTVKIQSKNLPSGKPVGFTGAIGKYNVDTKISHDSIDVNEAFTISVNLKGTGNLGLVKTPEINFPKEFEVYDPEIDQNLSQITSGTTGSITWTFTIIPRYPEHYVIDPIELSWFNTESKQYETYKSEPIRIYVNRTADFKESDVNFSSSKGNSSGNIIGEDIRYIKAIPTDMPKYFVGTTAFWLAYIVPFSLFVLLIIFRRKQIKERANISKMRNKKANRLAKKHLQNAKKFIGKNHSQFYTELNKAIWGYVGDKLDMDTAMMSRESISSGLSEKGLSDELITKLLKLIDMCEYAHYAPADKENEPGRVYQYATGLITKLEQNIK